jgi:hypothetical protein
MATPAQIDANRRNAQHSTGPRTPEGKDVSSRNATKFGLFTRHVLLPGEDEGELIALRESLRARLRPADTLEELYVERVVANTWRLQRALSGESTVFSSWKREHHFEADQVLAEQYPLRDLDSLQRHIASLERSIDRAMAQLEKLRKLRKEAEEDRGEKREEENGENEPNSTPTPERTASAPIEMVRTNPIQEGKSERKEGNGENEPNQHSGGGAFHAPAPVEIESAPGLDPPASVRDERCG